MTNIFCGLILKLILHFNSPDLTFSQKTDLKFYQAQNYLLNQIFIIKFIILVLVLKHGHSLGRDGILFLKRK